MIRSMKRDISGEFQPLRFSGFKANQQKDATMNQVVRALEAFLSQRVSVKKADKMQYTRMGKRMDDDVEEGMTKRDGMDKMQYTRMGKREDDSDQMRILLDNNGANMEEVEEKIMRWGLLGKRESNSNKMQFTRMGKRDGMDKMQYTRMGKRAKGKLQYTRMGKRNPEADEQLLGKTSAVKICC